MHRKKRIRRHYKGRITRRRENYDILDWASAESQQVRFAVLLREIDLAGKSLLDVGSGLGDLWAFIKPRRLGVDYVGVDLLDEMVRVAERMHPDARFFQADLFKEDLFENKQFDVVFCSGMLNLNLGNNLAFLPLAVTRMLDLAAEAVVFNLLHTRQAGRDKTYFYYDPADVVNRLRPLGCRLQLIDDYLPNDFTMICRPT